MAAAAGCRCPFSLPSLLLVLVSLCLLPGSAFAGRVVSFSHSPPSRGLEWNITLAGRLWLHGGDVSFRSANATFSTSDGSLVQSGAMRQSSGADSIGQYTSFTLSWTTAQSGSADAPLWETAFREYELGVDGSRGAVVFSQRWLSGASGTSTGDKNGVLSSFPAFRIGGSGVESQGYLQWGGTFAFTNTRVGRWSGGDALPALESGIRSGPVVLFDQSGQLVSVLSPLSSFMSASLVQEADLVQLGVLGSIRSVPAGWQLDSILYWESGGLNAINDCVEHWGDLLLSKYGKRRSDAYESHTVQFLGYNTDNGAYYYYNKEPGTSYEQTLFDVQAYWESLSLPFRFLWLDSWFYFKGPTGGDKNWTAMPSVFPRGLPAFQQQLRLPLIAHNRWWDAVTDYAQQNGGSYQFITEPDSSKWAVPVDQQFWSDLMFNATAWGLHVYQQDWLYNEFETVEALHTQVDLGRLWLRQMGLGAQMHGVTVMYCMPAPRHLLQSVEIPAVHQTRASDDYIPGNTRYSNWHIALTSLLAWSLGLAPSKDDFWTTSQQPGNPYNATEPDPLLQSLVATLSTGQVNPSDGIGFMDAAVINRSVRADGLILKPDRPALFLTPTYTDLAFSSSPNPNYDVSTSFTLGEYSWLYRLLVFNGSRQLQPALPHSLAQLLPSKARSAAERLGTRYVCHSLSREQLLAQADGTLTSGLSLADRVPTVPVAAGAAAGFPWVLFTLSPVMQSQRWGSGVSVLGEVLSKWTAMSAQRVRDLQVDEELVSLTLLGISQELVSVRYVWYNASVGQQGIVVDSQCAVGAAGSVQWSVNMQAPADFSCSTDSAPPARSSSPRLTDVM